MAYLPSPPQAPFGVIVTSRQESLFVLYTYNFSGFPSCDSINVKRSSDCKIWHHRQSVWQSQYDITGNQYGGQGDRDHRESVWWSLYDTTGNEYGGQGDIKGSMVVKVIPQVISTAVKVTSQAISMAVIRLLQDGNFPTGEFPQYNASECILLTTLALMNLKYIWH